MARTSKKEKNKRLRIWAFILLLLVFGLAAVILAACIYLANLHDDSKVSDELLHQTSSSELVDDYEIKGVDVSYFQKEIDWAGLAANDITFAYVKATEGSSHVDENFDRNWRDARKNIFRVGAYHFLSFDSEGETQAENFINTVPKKKNSLPPAVDVEFYGKYRAESNYPSQEDIDRVLQVVLTDLEKHYKKKPVIYTNSYIYNTYISGKYDDYSIWISDHSVPDRLDDNKKWTFCQYSFKGKSQYVANGDKYIDLDVFYGNKRQLGKFKGE